jgi:ribosomal protein S18 acetylase RimI-like enzyme
MSVSSSPEPPILELSSGDLPNVANLLAEAFQNDPLWLKYLPNPATRGQLLRKFFRVFVTYALHYGKVMGIKDPHDPNLLQAVLIWYPPGRGKVSSWGMIRSGILRLVFGPLGKFFIAGRHFFAHSDRLHELHAPPTHYYLSLLSVSPNCQGNGLAGKLMRSQLKLFASENIPAYLETSNPANVPIYQHLGFTMKEDFVVPESGIHIWAFVYDKFS